MQKISLGPPYFKSACLPHAEDLETADPLPPGPPYFIASEVDHIRASLLEWYDRVHRVLPWRRTPHSKRGITVAAAAAAPAAPNVGQKRSDGGAAPLPLALPAPASLDPQRFAYYVWVSEIMLQQTQVGDGHRSAMILWLCCCTLTVVSYFNK